MSNTYNAGRYIKQNYGCHCFYNDSSFKRYNRFHTGGDTLIFNFGSGCGCNGFMSTCGNMWRGLGNSFGSNFLYGLGMGIGNWLGGCWGGMTNWLGGCWGGMTNWFGGCYGAMDNMFGGGGFAGGLGYGLGMGLPGLIGTGINWISSLIGNRSGSSSVGNSSGLASQSGASTVAQTGSSQTQHTGSSQTQQTGSSQTQQTGSSQTQQTGSSQTQQTGASQTQQTGSSLTAQSTSGSTQNAQLTSGGNTVQTPAEIIDSIGDINNLLTDDLEAAKERLQSLLDNSGLNEEDEANVNDLLKQINDKLKLAGELDLDDGEVIANDKVLKIEDLTPEDIADLDYDDIAKIIELDKFDAIIAKLGVEKVDNNGKEILSLPETMDVNSIKALAKLSEAAGIPVAMGYNSNSKIVDHYIAGYIDPESVKLNDDDKLTYDIDCKEVPEARFGNKYTVTQKEGTLYNIKVNTPLNDGTINPKFNESGVEYELKDKQLERKGEAYIKDK